jgi:hypothetical protein
MGFMRRFFPRPVIYCLFILIFPLVRWLRRPDDALVRCAPARWRIAADGRLACGGGRPLTSLERLSLGLDVDANSLNEDQWRSLVGRTLAARLEARRRREGRLCRWRLAELGDELAGEVLRRLPDSLNCGPRPPPGP